MKVIVDGMNGKVYQGTLQWTDHGKLKRENLPLGFYSSKKLLADAAELLMQEFLKIRTEWRRAEVLPNNVVIACAKWHEGHWNEASIEVVMNEIPVLESVVQVQVMVP